VADRSTLHLANVCVEATSYPNPDTGEDEPVFALMPLSHDGIDIDDEEAVSAAVAIQVVKRANTRKDIVFVTADDLLSMAIQAQIAVHEDDPDKALATIIHLVNVEVNDYKADVAEAAAEEGAEPPDGIIYN
jgi:hypothetical protein